MRAPDYRRGRARAAYMKGTRDRHRASMSASAGPRRTVWTCDLTHRYIDINGAYRS